MSKIQHEKVENKGSDTPFLDTLGYLPTNPEILGSDVLRKRARSKWYTQAIVGRLLFLGSDLHKYYQRAFYCNSILIQEGKAIRSTYCDTRTCNICNRIRTANLMNGYLPQFEGRHIEFVTLTLPNVEGKDLRFTIEWIIKESANMIRLFRERRGIEINGIRKIEVTYNAITDTYHPHIHLIVDKCGQLIVDEWLKRNPTAVIKAQDCTPADQNSLNELFKYTTKIIGRKSGDLVVYVNALDRIMIALKNKRCFQPFGDIKKVSEEVNSELQGQEYNIPEYDFMIWKWDECDWVNSDRETLTGYISPDIEIVYK